MAGYTGAWRAKASNATLDYGFENAQKWGTGWNPIHAHHATDRLGRSLKDTYDLSDDPNAGQGTVSSDVVDEYAPEYFGYGDEDSASTLWGYGVDTGTADRASWGQDHADVGGMMDIEGYPSWGPEPGGILPGGSELRSIDRGADATLTAKVTPDEDVAQGWRNKVHDAEPLDAVTSDQSQYEMQTSMTQRDKTRAGSQAAAGRANEFDAPIKSRLIGMKERFWAASPNDPRHDDMEPRSQDTIIRPFWVRTAGTGYRDWMHPNELYVSEPKQRTPPDNPYQGENVAQADQLANMGYTQEDVFF
jgi:hypothetical protein